MWKSAYCAYQCMTRCQIAYNRRAVQRMGLSSMATASRPQTLISKPQTQSNSVNNQAPLLTAQKQESAISFVHHPYSLTEEPLPSSFTTKDLFAIIEFSGTQYKVTSDDMLVANHIDNIDIGQIIDVGKVLMIGSRKGTVIGQPYVEGAKVTAEVEEITKDRKVIIFKMRRRKNSKRLKGFRRSVVILRIKDISLGVNIQEYVNKL